MKILKAIVSLPYATPDGKLVIMPGYDAETGIFAAFSNDMPLSIPTAPNEADVVNALQTIWKPWSAYRFASNTDRAAMLAAIITSVCRPALATAPGFFFDAPVQASGKTKCAGALGALMRGKRGGISPFVDGVGVEAETVKKLVSMSLSGEEFWLIDNVVGCWRSAVIAGVMTDGMLNERILGSNSWYRGEARMMICATGNNASLDRDLGRRFIRVRIDPGVETPQSRSFEFDPIDLALTMRMDIALAVLVIVRAFWQADPKPQGRGDAGFNEWNRLVRQCVLWIGTSGLGAGSGLGEIGDPAQSILDGASADDPETTAHRMLLNGLYEQFTGLPFKAKDVLRLWEIGGHCSVDEAAGMVREGLAAMLGRMAVPSAVSIGKILRNRRDRLVGGLCLRQVGSDRNGVAEWSISGAGDAGGGGAESPHFS